MSETPPNQPQPDQNAPVMRVLNQYVKDLSFENPNAPQAVRPDLPAPAVDVAVDVNARSLGQDQYEVELSCSANATRDGNTVFVVEVNYAGHFLIQNVPQEHLESVLLVNAPQLLFPFARQVVATATRDGGFMPLMLEPLDFAGMYQMQLAKRQQAARDNAAAGDGPPEVGSA
ncbi:protein-export chaperone SecB [Parvularcula oceani]|uniref:protein-export chaperone SecB n=1 Tax=Parvularcula oceani TaxID=1247963 RepID=UPI0004E1ECCC|nr:protein-export chaperone SecB [Parvularcula oceani]